MALTLSTPLGTFLQSAGTWTTCCKEEPFYYYFFWLVQHLQSKLRHRRHGRYQISGRWNCEQHRRSQEARSSRFPKSQTDGSVQLQSKFAKPLSSSTTFVDGRVQVKRAFKTRLLRHCCKANLFREDVISNFGFEIVLTIGWLNTPSMVISIVRRHPALLLGKQRFERADP